MQEIRTRFAPSPTGFLHIGGARTALFAWAFARKHKGKFILRIEDTDVARSTQESVESIINAMKWLNLNFDEGPYYQTKRLARYQEVAESLIKSGHAYYCYCTKEELDQMREEQRLANLKPKYDRRCLHNPPHNSQVKPVLRFKNPDMGSVVWQDLVKGQIEISKEELDDLIILRSNGVPTYNFCVVVDDMDMNITHVIRGDDHVNNTPRQINILQALGVNIPYYAHVPMILRDDGQKMSKRTDAVSVMQYKDLGILPEALLNYLARLCWGHHDDEIFTLEQFVEWFDLTHISSSPARFDMQKLKWVNSMHIKSAPLDQLSLEIKNILVNDNVIIDNRIDLNQVIDLVKTRVDNLVDLAKECKYFYAPLELTPENKTQYLNSNSLELLNSFSLELKNLTNWSLDNIKQLIKDFCKTHNIKMPELGMPLRLKLCGTTSTPSFDSVIYVLGEEVALERLTKS